jgi:hypothetical protein
MSKLHKWIGYSQLYLEYGVFLTNTCSYDTSHTSTNQPLWQLHTAPLTHVVSWKHSELYRLIRTMYKSRGIHPRTRSVFCISSILLLFHPSIIYHCHYNYCYFNKRQSTNQPYTIFDASLPAFPPIHSMPSPLHSFVVSSPKKKGTIKEDRVA